MGLLPAKVVLLGAGDAGKSTIFQQLMQDQLARHPWHGATQAALAPTSAATATPLAVSHVVSASALVVQLHACVGVWASVLYPAAGAGTAPARPLAVDTPTLRIAGTSILCV